MNLWESYLNVEYPVESIIKLNTHSGFLIEYEIPYAIYSYLDSTIVWKIHRHGHLLTLSRGESISLIDYLQEIGFYTSLQ